MGFNPGMGIKRAYQIGNEGERAPNRIVEDQKFLMVWPHIQRAPSKTELES